MKFKALYLTTGHVVCGIRPSVRPHASRPPATRPSARLICPSTHSSAHPPIHPVHPLAQPAHPTDRCRILSVLMARSHLTQAMRCPPPRQTACSGTSSADPPSSNPLTKLLTCRPCGLQIIAYFVGVPFSDWLGYDII